MELSACIARFRENLETSNDKQIIDRHYYSSGSPILPAEQEAGFKAYIAVVLGMFLLDWNADFAHVIGSIVNALNRGEADIGTFFDVFADFCDHRLGGGKVTGGIDDDLAVAFDAKVIHLAVGADLINTRIGARVWAKNQAGIDFDRNAIGHNSNQTQEKNGA